MKQNFKQKGFTAVEGLLLLLVAGIVGFTGWYVWSSKKDADKSYNSASQVGSNIPEYKSVKNFDECKKAGGRIQESYPEVCVYGGKSFTNPEQQSDSEQFCEYSRCVSFGSDWQKTTEEYEGYGEDGKYKSEKLTLRNSKYNNLEIRFLPRVDGIGYDCQEANVKYIYSVSEARGLYIVGETTSFQEIRNSKPYGEVIYSITVFATSTPQKPNAGTTDCDSSPFFRNKNGDNLSLGSLVATKRFTSEKDATNWFNSEEFKATKTVFQTLDIK